MDATDHDLLRQFNAHRSEDAFRQLVNRHVGMVFSVASRVTGDRHLAEEISQTTFATFAQRAGSLHEDDVIAGWLYHTARHLAWRVVRSEQRRRQREQIAATMNTDEPGPSVVAEHLESAMDQLPPADRDALVLRFFEDRNLRDVGHELGLTEDAARMRVNRALEKLRGVFGKLGLTASVTRLAATLPTSATVAAPAGLGTSITTAVLSGTAVAAATTAILTQTTATTMNLFNLKTAAAILGVAAVTGTTTYLVQERQAERLRVDYRALNAGQAKLTKDSQDARDTIRLRDEQIEQLLKNVSELPRLRGEVDRLNRLLAEADRMRIQNDQLKLSLATLQKQAQAQTSDEEIDKLARAIAEERAAGILRMNDMRTLGLAWVMHADTNQGWAPDGRQFAELVQDHSGKLKELQPDNVEIVFQGRLKELPEDAWRRIIVLKQSDFTTATDGQKIMRAYGFADGHSEIHAASSLQELTAWENEHIIPRGGQSVRP